MLLSHMKEIAEAHFGTLVANAVVTVPASFNYAQRLGIRDARLISGLNIIRFIDEPDAIAISYDLNHARARGDTTYPGKKSVNYLVCQSSFIPGPPLLHIYEGFGTLAKDNIVIGTLDLSQFSPLPSEIVIEIDIDASSGLVTVKAKANVEAKAPQEISEVCTWGILPAHDVQRMTHLAEKLDGKRNSFL